MQNNPVQDEMKHSTMNDREDEQTIDLVALFYRLMEKIVWIILPALIGGILMGVISYKVLKPTYQATSKLYIVGSDTTISLSDLQLGSNLTADYQEVFRNWHVHEIVSQRLHATKGYEEDMLSVTGNKTTGSITVTNPQGTHVLYITAVAKDPVMAKDIADTYAEVAREFIAAKMDMREPNIFEEARLGLQIGPNKTRNIMLGLLLGGLLAVAVITIQFLLDDRIRTEEDITKSTGLATLGMVPLQDTQKLGLPDEHLNRKKN